ncbi:MAG: RNA polymerase factor sigma-54 [Bacillota bacterium]
MQRRQQITANQVQQLALTPELRQSLTVLQMPFIELQAYLDQQLLENCLLEQDEQRLSEETPVEFLSINNLEAKENVMNNPVEDSLVDSPDEPGSTPGDNQFKYYEELRTPLPSLQEYLFTQLHLIDLSEPEKAIAEFLIENIDEDGYLQTGLEKVADLFQATTEVVENLLYLIQSFEPLGVGARDLRECLLLQLKFRGDLFPGFELSKKKILSTAMTIIEDYLYELADGKISQIAVKLKIPTEEVQAAVAVIKGLDPKPGCSFGGNRENRFITPDVTIRKIDEAYFITINEPENAKLSLNPFYRQLSLNREAIDEETLEFIKEKQRAALQLLKCIEQRRATLYRITENLLNIQKEFLERGVLYLKPLTLRQIAGALGIHESTVSRAIAGKYLDTPRGVYPFKYFFAAGLESPMGETVSAEKVKNLIKMTIAKEETKAPFSDQQLVKILQDKGVSVSRRTVAKYREELRIPASPKRRRY